MCCRSDASHRAGGPQPGLPRNALNAPADQPVALANAVTSSRLMQATTCGAVFAMT